MKLLKSNRLYLIILVAFIFQTYAICQIPSNYCHLAFNKQQDIYININTTIENKYSGKVIQPEILKLNRNYLRNELNEFNFKIAPDLISLNRRIRGRQFEEVMGMISMISAGPLLLGAIVNSAFGSETTVRNFGIGAACTGIGGIVLFVDGRINRKALQYQKDLIIEEYMVLTP